MFIDEKTLKLLKSRDPELLSALFLEMNPFLLRVCATNGFFNENADEVIHDTWEKFFTNIEKFEGRSQIKTFICGILFNKIREARRAQGKVDYIDDSEEVMNQAFSHDGWWKLPPRNPQKLYELKKVSQYIEECLEGLTEQQKTAFLMTEVEDQNSEEICHILGVNVSHLRVLLFRAKDKLRKCLEGRY